MANVENCVIIGASHAAVQLMISLRQLGWRGSITVISDDPNMPYHKPPLSKAYLSGETTDEQLALRAAPVYEKLDVTFKLGETVAKIDRDGKSVVLASGEQISYAKLALCTGARVRPLPAPGTNLAGVHYLRTMDDVKGIKKSMETSKNAVIIGGGYIGLETAASLKKLGINVTVLEAEARLLQRVATEQVSSFFRRLHEEEGVEILRNTQASKLVGSEKLEKVFCSDGREIKADLAIIGIGVIPNTELAENAGLETDNGILVDEFAKTSDPDIVAAGDCTNHPSKIAGKNIRLESVPNATEQAKAAAASICGTPKEYNELPWFWSDQFDVKLQIAGLNEGYTDTVVRGDIENGRSFSVFYLKNDKLIAADCVNNLKDFMFTKKLILQDQVIDKAALSDETVELKSLLT